VHFSFGNNFLHSFVCRYKVRIIIMYCTLCAVIVGLIAGVSIIGIVCYCYVENRRINKDRKKEESEKKMKNVSGEWV
jgi:uncharacterized protein (DUF2062 family)